MQPVQLKSERERRAKVSHSAASAVLQLRLQFFGPSTAI